MTKPPGPRIVSQPNRAEVERRIVELRQGEDPARQIQDDYLKELVRSDHARPTLKWFLIIVAIVVLIQIEFLWLVLNSIYDSLAPYFTSASGTPD